MHREDRLFIGGEWVEPIDGSTIESIDPSTGRGWAEVAFAGKRDVDRAVTAAREAFEGPWRRMPGHERAELLRRFAELYRRAAPELARMEAQDNGRVIRETRADLANHQSPLGEAYRSLRTALQFADVGHWPSVRSKGQG